MPLSLLKIKSLPRIVQWGLWILVLCVLITLSLVGSVWLGLFGKLPSKSEIQSYRNAYASEIRSADRAVLGYVHSTYRLPSDNNAVPPHLVDALISVEDTRFMDHGGIDYRSLFRVLFKTLLMGNKASGGGSTLSQQLIKNMYGRDTEHAAVVYKLREMIIAKRMEEVLSKDEILSLYLNTVPFGENTYGIEAASIRFFGKSAIDLSVEESATLVGILKANTYYNPRLNPNAAISRRNHILKKWGAANKVSEQTLDSLLRLPLQLNYSPIQEQFNGYLIAEITKRAQTLIDTAQYNIQKDGLIIHTTVRKDIQDIAIAQFTRQLKKMQDLLKAQYSSASGQRLLRKHMGKQSIDSTEANHLVALHGGVLITEPKNGNILAYVGGKDFYRYPYDQIKAKRQMASSFKPFLFAAAIEQGTDVCDYIDNRPLVLKEYNWTPENYDKSTGGKYTLAAALAKSLNLPAVRLYLNQEDGVVENFWSRLPFESNLKPSPVVALGTVDASLYEMAHGYSVFPNSGYTVEPYLIERITTTDGTIIYQKENKETRRVCNASTADPICAALQKSVTIGTASALQTTFGFQPRFAVKTGTSQSYRDAWVTGFNSNFLITVRIGANNPRIHFVSGANGSSTKLALPVMASILNDLQKQSSTAAYVTAGFPYHQRPNWDCPDFKEDGPLRELWDKLKTLPEAVEEKGKTAKKKRRWSKLKKKMEEIYDDL